MEFEWDVDQPPISPVSAARRRFIFALRLAGMIALLVVASFLIHFGSSLMW
jgi:hypothetical protein